ncbi:MAG TPA: helix-turn-helix domain-containing protein [Ktedonobacteraceae bacterium]|jgi:AcrR family transcriptional regulator
MPRTTEANQRIREAQREKILDAARSVFARKGRAATIADVAAEAEISQGLAYRYFASKEALFQALAEQTTQSILTTLQRIMDMPGTPGERLEFLISRAVKGQREHREIFQLLDQVFSEEAAPADVRELAWRQGQALRGVMRQLIVEGQATGEVAAGDPDQLVTVVMACLRGLTLLALRNPERFNQHVPDATLILRILKPCAGQ